MKQVSRLIDMKRFKCFSIFILKKKQRVKTIKQENESQLNYISCQQHFE